MLTYPDYHHDYMPYQYACCNTQTMIDHAHMYRANVAPMMTYNPLILGLINACETPKPKSGRKVYRDLGDCWIVVAYESGPLKLLELELK